jgi:alpha-glucosidase
MPWLSNAPDLGFSEGAVATQKPWLPVSESHRALAVNVQEQDDASLLNFYRRVLHWRRTQPALVQGDLSLLDLHPQVFGFVRSLGAERVLCLFNLSDSAATLAIPAPWVPDRVLSECGLSGAELQGAGVEFAPWGGIFIALK